LLNHCNRWPKTIHTNNFSKQRHVSKLSVFTDVPISAKLYPKTPLFYTGLIMLSFRKHKYTIYLTQAITMQIAYIYPRVNIKYQN